MGRSQVELAKDPTIREKFGACRFAGHKEKLIGALRRVSRASVETRCITESMRTVKR